ncbi:MULTISPECIES: HD family phosphohydrolase [unclassified Aureispira]|uniref:HD family phosphohydrolase n=1 Tax=unclassified Aureispira TaxID=2649989 RepID=UPI000696894A|nr:MULTISPECIES: HDIG domain-containing metalloprotein [unclassified Aureispira]WMX12145.1 HDIG domain-containing protein [Aureispira sp. CCB-E]
MSLKIIQNSIDTIPHIVRFILLGMLALFISLFFPTNLNFDYDFEQGKRWKHNDLKAPFDFPIKKTPQEIEWERARIAKQIDPYYRWDKEVITTQKQAFEKAFHTAWALYEPNDSSQLLDSLEYVRFGLEVLDKIYTKRLIELEPKHREQKENFVFDLLDGNVDLGEFSVQDVYTNKAAIQFLVDTLYSVEDELTESKFLSDLLEQILVVPNITFDSIVTQKSLEDAFNSVSPYRGMVKAGDPIVTRDRLIDSITYSKLISYQTKYNQEINQHKNSWLIYLGYLALTIALIAIFALFVQFYTPEVFYNFRHLSLILLIIAGYAYLAYIVHDIYILDLYVIPFCIIPIIIINFFNAQLALFTHVIIILLISMLLSLDYHFILIQILVGMVAVVNKLKTRHLSDFFVSLLYIGIAYAAGFISLELIHTGTIFPIVSDNGTVIEEGVRWHMLGWVLFNVFLTLLSYPLIPLFEKLFGLTSDITLVELADMDNYLLKELSIRAPGTLQHSLQVANLSEAAAKVIGANSLLVKVAALYHDIGKMSNPQYYIENQNDSSPHSKLTNLESAQMIIKHVTEGVKLAKKNRLPTVLIDFILTHHGTTRVEYFYRMEQKEQPDKEIDPTNFTYPGPKPQTKEQAIMMMADSLEAASKSLKSPTEEDINNLVENIIKGKITMGQLENTNLSFQELEEVKKVFKKLLKSMNHVRIAYPDEEKK